MEETSVSAQIENYLAEYVEAWPFSGSVLVAKEGTVIFKRGYGYASIEHQIPNTTLSPEEVIGLFKDKPLSFEPGTAYAYCNSGYYLLGLIIERVSGLCYRDFLQSKIFQPLGMNGTVVDGNKIVVHGMACGYQMDGEELVRSEYIDMSGSFSAGGHYSTVEDLFLWDQAL
ncbi:serine hydrolase domain-containing protein [Paenibacillus alkalitolerans]|uniref:serine hydrolase domain-containing protein n=1 Tax=Paenibacillus alkalitolerans TaxID=2799335 RepID=UPI0018F7CE8D|nr:serine hydrolase domain-containing protein [Paenibacillus alkalitolerans]